VHHVRENDVILRDHISNHWQDEWIPITPFIRASNTDVIMSPKRLLTRLTSGAVRPLTKRIVLTTVLPRQYVRDKAWRILHATATKGKHELISRVRSETLCSLIDSIDVPEASIFSIQGWAKPETSKKQAASRAACWILAWRIFDTEDGGYTFIRNVSVFLPNYITLQPRI
jgi:hypothetical protein